MGALAKATPERVIAATAHFFNPNIGGTHPVTGRPYICWESIIGGIGARATKDGIEATSSPWNGTVPDRDPGEPQPGDDRAPRADSEFGRGGAVTAAAAASERTCGCWPIRER